MDLTTYLWRRSGQERGDTTLSHRREFSHTLKKGSKACTKTMHLANPQMLFSKLNNKKNPVITVFKELKV